MQNEYFQYILLIMQCFKIVITSEVELTNWENLHWEDWGSHTTICWINNPFWMEKKSIHVYKVIVELFVSLIYSN